MAFAPGQSCVVANSAAPPCLFTACFDPSCCGSRVGSPSFSTAHRGQLRIAPLCAAQAIDEQVEQLTSAAGKALGTFWTGLSTAWHSGVQAASTVARDVESAALSAASRVAVHMHHHGAAGCVPD
jgi:hypothetical protein